MCAMAFLVIENPDRARSDLRERSAAAKFNLLHELSRLVGLCLPPASVLRLLVRHLVMMIPASFVCPESDITRRALGAMLAPTGYKIL